MVRAIGIRVNQRQYQISVIVQHWSDRFCDAECSDDQLAHY